MEGRPRQKISTTTSASKKHGITCAPCAYCICCSGKASYWSIFIARLDSSGPPKEVLCTQKNYRYRYRYQLTATVPVVVAVIAAVTATDTIQSTQFCHNMRALRMNTVPVVQEKPAAEASSLLVRIPRVLRKTRAIFSRPVAKHSKHTAQRKNIYIYICNGTYYI